MKHELRPHQLSGLDGLRQKIREGFRRIVLMGACGFGKTTVASAMIQGAVEKGKRAIFIVDRIELAEQASARLDAEGIDHGVVQGNHWRYRPHYPVQVCSIQTLARREIPPFDLAIIDECHVLHKAHQTLMQRFPQVPFIGLSASPFTRGLGRHFQAIVVAASTRELIDLGYLVDARVFAPSQPDVSKVKIVAGEYHEGQLADATDKGELVADIVSTWQRLGEDRQTLAFAVNIAHSKHICEQFKAAGIAAEHIDAHTDQMQRYYTVRDFKTGKIRVLVNVGILDKGFDYPGASCLIMARPTKSLMVYIQQAGRVLRIADGKQDALILDHAGNTARHGFVTDDLPTELDDGKKRDAKARERKEPLPSSCPSCKFMRPARVHKCPNCGFAPERQSNVEHKDGELIEVKRAKVPVAEKERVYAELRGYAQIHGYKDGWAYFQHQKKFGTYPARKVQPKEPSEETLRWIRHTQIRYAKHKEKEQRNAA